jgi:hypothetical protein
MAIVLDSPAPSTPPTTLLSTLKSLTALHQTRRSLLAELDLSLSSFLSPSSSAPGEVPDVLSAPSDPDFAPLTPARTGNSCQGEALNPPPPRSDEELQELLRIAFGGLVEVKEEVKVLLGVLGGETYGTEGQRLEAIVEKVEGWESERVKAVSISLFPGRSSPSPSFSPNGSSDSGLVRMTDFFFSLSFSLTLRYPQTLELYQLRRLLVLQPELAESVDEKVKESLCVFPSFLLLLPSLFSSRLYHFAASSPTSSPLQPRSLLSTLPQLRVLLTPCLLHLLFLPFPPFRSPSSNSRKSLAHQIQEEMEEVRAEITDLQAAEEEEKEKQQ